MFNRGDTTNGKYTLLNFKFTFLDIALCGFTTKPSELKYLTVIIKNTCERRNYDEMRLKFNHNIDGKDAQHFIKQY